jgi:uncharacterized SAM-binding protein YcdF (DUF218 family)
MFGPRNMAFPVIVVLGCRAHADRPRGALLRRVDQAYAAYQLGSGTPLLIVTGGRRWSGQTEAEIMRRALLERGVPSHDLLPETRSLNTIENAFYSAHICRSRECHEILLVTCDWHMPRARRCFERQGLRVQACPAPSPDASAAVRAWRRVREVGRELMGHLVATGSRVT